MRRPRRNGSGEGRDRAGRAVALLLTLLAALAGPAPGSGQEVRVFRATQVANLPTATTIGEGRWLFEVSHRFLPPVSEGADALWGLDGPAINRLGLAWAPTERVMVGVLRSNLNDNLELNGRLRLVEGRPAGVPVATAVVGGVAWNTDAPPDPGVDGNEVQAYAQVVLNALVAERLSLGLVPSLLHNPVIEDEEAETDVTVGLVAQLRLNRTVSVFTEWNLGEAREDLEDDPGSFGVALDVGGHVFTLLLTNAVRANPTQFLAGAPFPFEPDAWRFGFNITRLLFF